jgi:hypothetical protein
MALLDTGASANVLPYETGLQPGVVWENQTVQIPLSGNLVHSESRGPVLTGTVAHFAPVLLAFAWTQSTDVPVILGHMNFGSSLLFMLNQQTRCQDNILLTQKFRKFLKP